VPCRGRGCCGVRTSPVRRALHAHMPAMLSSS
jgi:hypothetical protein